MLKPQETHNPEPSVATPPPTPPLRAVELQRDLQKENLSCNQDLSSSLFCCTSLLSEPNM